MKIHLISCVSKKGDSPALARDLYQSQWFRLARAYAESTHCPWYILSAKYGLVRDIAEIEPYEMTLKEKSRENRERWAQWVVRQLSVQWNLPAVHELTIEILAGAAYREFLLEELEQEGATVTVPMAGLGIGQQMAWLKAKAAKP